MWRCISNGFSAVKVKLLLGASSLGTLLTLVWDGIKLAHHTAQYLHRVPATKPPPMVTVLPEQPILRNLKPSRISKYMSGFRLWAHFIKNSEVC